MTRLWFLLVAIMMLVGLASLDALAQTGRGMKVVVQTAEGGSLLLYDNSWAVIIGINQYQKWTSLQYAVNDAKAVRDKLVTLGFPAQNIIVLTDAQATKERIELVLGDELRRRTGENDRGFIYFAGHGQTEDLPGGKKEGYIVPVDGDRFNLFSTCISMTTVRQFSERMAAKHVFYAIDACYSGLALMRSGELDPRAQQYLQKIARLPSRQLIAAGSAGEQVVERGGHGAFTRTLLIALDGSADKFPPFGVLTGSELGDYLKPTVSFETNNAQTPQFGRISAGEGEFVFVLPDAGSPPTLTDAPSPPVTPPAAVPPTTDIVPAPPGMMYIPGETFRMGSNDGASDERPVHTVTVDGFWIDMYEVTNAEFERFVQATGYQAKKDWRKLYNAGRERYPVVYVTWNDAVAYTRWAGKRLPTEAEWEYAARGGLEGKRYPWGDEIRPELANYDAQENRSYSDKEALRYLQPVGSYPSNGYGLYDVVGNVGEWVADWYNAQYYEHSPERNPPGPVSWCARRLVVR